MIFKVNHSLEISLRSQIQFLLNCRNNVLNGGNNIKVNVKHILIVINQMSATSCLCDSNAIINTLMTFNQLRNFWNHDQNL